MAILLDSLKQFGKQGGHPALRKAYAAEFKRQAIELAAHEDIGPSRAARDLGIRLSALSRWRKQAEKLGSHAFPGHGRTAMTPQEQELQRLRKENEILRQEREILKKAAACLGQNSTRIGLGRFFAREQP